MHDKARIGFVGLGSMGLPMARNLVAAGHEVAGHDIRPTPMAALCAAGGQAAATACDAARDAGILILMVVDAAQAREVLIAQGAARALLPGGIVALMSTCLADEVAALGREVAATGRVLVDAPVSGGVVGAEAGTLSIMAAGDVDALARLPVGIDRKPKGHDIGFRDGLGDRAGQRAGVAEAAQFDRMRHGRNRGVRMQAKLFPEIQLGQRQRQPMRIRALIRHENPVPRGGAWVS